MSASRPYLLAVVLAVAPACSQAARPTYPPSPPIWQDPDRRPFGPKPERYESPLLWDGANHLVLLPATDFLRVDPVEEAVNVNAFDEVADSSWFTNRIGLHAFSPEDLAAGPCSTPPLDPSVPWKVTGAKLEGATPGFVIEGSDGRRYVMKFDGVEQPPHPTAADAIGSRIFYAAGFTAPCNRIVFFDRSKLEIAPGAKTKTWTGETLPFTERDLDLILSYGGRLKDGRYRAMSSLLLEGESLGPFKYEGTRDDDPNDIIDHENRRELRGARILSSWIAHNDAREENTLTTWMPASAGQGWVRHAYIDFSDCFGEVWDPPAVGRRLGHEYVFHVGAIARNLLTLGAVHEPWESMRFGVTGKVFGYYDVQHFDPDEWVTYYPNTAFSRMTERDGAWMARIIAHFTDAHLERVIRTGMLSDPLLQKELLRVLRGRRAKVLERHLLPLSPLAEPTVRVGSAGSQLCLRDLAVLSTLRAPGAVGYTASYRAGAGGDTRRLRVEAAKGEAGEAICVALPTLPRVLTTPFYFQVDVATTAPREGRIRLHLYRRTQDTLVVGLERFPRN